VLAAAEQAARLELEGLTRESNRYRAALGEADWAHLHVIIIGAHMARQDEIATQFFARLLGEHEEGDRIIFAEGLWEEPRALELYGTHLLDRAAGLAFFGDPDRMHRDLLADAAKLLLQPK
jgi:hypothetical protein